MRLPCSRFRLVPQGVGWHVVASSTTLQHVVLRSTLMPLGAEALAWEMLEEVQLAVAERSGLHVTKARRAATRGEEGGPDR